MTKETKVSTVENFSIEAVNNLISKKVDSILFTTLAEYMQVATPEQIDNLPTLTIKQFNVTLARKSTGNGTLRYTDNQKELVDYLSNVDKLVTKQDFVKETGREHRLILATIKGLRNASRPDEQRIVMNVSVATGKVIYKYCLASRCEEFGVEINSIVDTK